MAFLVIAILILLAFSARFRLVSLFLIAVVAIGGYIIYLNGEKHEALAKSRIPATDVSITDGHIELQNGTYRFLGRITNNSSKYTLQYIELHAIAHDCSTSRDTRPCIAIGEAHETIGITVPPGQARDLNEPLYTISGNLAPKGVINWKYDISQTRAY